MLDWITKHALEWLKTPAHYFLPLLAASFFGLFAPLDLMKSLGIEAWRTEGKFYIGSVFVISLAVVGCHYISEIIKWVINKYSMFLSLWSAKARLKSLTREEKEFLSRYIKEESRVQGHWRNSPIAAVLRADGIIYVAVEQGLVDNFPFTIAPWAWKYLHKNPHLVGIDVVKSVAKHGSNP